MKSEQRPWWQKNRQVLMRAGSVAGVIGVAVLIFAGYLLNWAWTGFFNKTLWDWMQLLIIPAVLTVGAFLFNRAERISEQAIALDNQRAATLQTYLDRMSKLLLKKSLRTSKPDDEVRNVARTQTLTVVRGLDGNRKRTVLQFLYESGLISNHEGQSIVSLERASLQGINLHNADLAGANLNRTSLRQADLRNANLHKTSLCRAKLTDANLSEADLSEADLSDTILDGVKLCHADLSHANLCGADLSGADLRGAIVTPEQLEKAKSLKSIMQ
jgi:uncharacterized protein YjbI with pentapeptide repeats